MLRTAIAVVVLTLAATLLACGSSSHTAATATHVPAAASKDTAANAGSLSTRRAPPTKKQARVFARAVNLRAQDMPGFRVSHEREQKTQAEKRLDANLQRCTGGPSPKLQLLEANSAEYEKESDAGAEGVQSEVTVGRTRGAAAQDIAALRSARGKRCLSRYLKKLFTGKKFEGATVDNVSISVGTPPATGTGGSVALRVRATMNLRGIRARFYMDFLAFVYGPAEVTLFTFSVPQPFAARTEERLYALLVQRARAQRI
jgi:hypothetical protein